MGSSSRRDFLAQIAGAGALLGAPRSAHAERFGEFAESIGHQEIPKRIISRTDEYLPIVGFGSSKSVLEIPTAGTDPIERVIRVMLDHGGTVVDTSPRTEEIDERFGQVLQHADYADRLFVATKINTTDPETGIAQMRQNQRLFGRGTVDLVQIESLRGVDEHWPRLREWKDAGDARYIGVTVSNLADHEALEGFMARERPDFVHVNYSILERRAEYRVLPLAQDRGMAVLVNRPFLNGEWFSKVAGQELPEWTAEFDCHAWSQFSLKYILSNPLVTCVLTETTNPEHMAENIAAAFGAFPDEQQKRRMRQLASQL